LRSLIFDCVISACGHKILLPHVIAAAAHHDAVFAGNFVFRDPVT
jgi:hypothetical protein